MTIPDGVLEATNCMTWDEVFDNEPLPWYQNLFINIEIFIEGIPVKFRNLLRYLFWPECDCCDKPAYYEHYCLYCEPKHSDGWFYVCWECSFKYKGHGPVE